MLVTWIHSAVYSIFMSYFKRQLFLLYNDALQLPEFSHINSVYWSLKIRINYSSNSIKLFKLFKVN